MQSITGFESRRVRPIGCDQWHCDNAGRPRLIWGEYRDKFDYAPESLFGKTICVPGTITEHKGKPEIKVTNPSQIRLTSN